MKKISLLLLGNFIILSTNTFASAYKPWEQDGASTGNFHAGTQAEAKDASVAFYNPGGILNIKNPQLAVGANTYFTNGLFHGTVATNSFMANAPQTVNAEGGGTVIAPNFNFVTPINNRVGFGFSIVPAFGLEIDYGRDTALKYAFFRGNMQVIDVSPSLAFQITPKLSFGIGVDAQKMYLKTSNVGTLGGLEATSYFSSTDIAYGYHFGALYQFTPATRIGISYHSQVVHHPHGTVRLEGPLADTFNNGSSIISTNARTNLTLPGYAGLGFYHDFNTTWSTMASVIYTQWDVTQRDYILQNAAGLTPTLQPTTSITVVAQQPYRNTWFVSLGSDYHINETLMMRGGIAFDQSPVQNAFRNVAIPDINHTILALGARINASKKIVLDFGWSHVFSPNAQIYNPPVNQAGQISAVNGSIQPSADIFGAQLTWNFV